MKKTVNNHETKRNTSIYFIVFVINIFVLVTGGMVSVYAQSGAGQYVKPENRKSVNPLAGVGMDYPLPVRLPEIINTVHEEIKPTISADGSTLYFSRQHYPFNLPGILNYEDIWSSTFDETTRTWSEPENIGPPVKNGGPNTNSYLRINGDTILLASEYKENGKTKEDILISIKEEEEWSFFHPFNMNDSLNTAIKSEIISGEIPRTILSAVKKDDTWGKNDIYVTLINADGSMLMKNLGNTVNTFEDESAPFLAADNKTLYFASRGHGGYGGYDIFVTERLDDSWQKWSEPENMGPYVNTEMDEEYYNYQQDSPYAYFTRQVSCRNSDIFMMAIPTRQQAYMKNSR